MKTQVKQRKMGITALCASLLHYKMFWSHTNLLIKLEWKGFPGKRDLNRLQVSLLFLIISKTIMTAYVCTQLSDFQFWFTG